LTLDGRNITGIIINNPNTSLYGSAISNPNSLLEVHSTQNLTIGGLQGDDFYNLRIVGSGNTVTLLPNAGSPTIHIQGDIVFDAAALAYTNDHTVLNLVGEVSVDIPTVGNWAPIYLDLTYVQGYAQIISRGVTIYASSDVDYFVALIDNGVELSIILSRVPASGIWPVFVDKTPGTTIRIGPNRVIEVIDTP